jgi:hypothetical protein
MSSQIEKECIAREPTLEKYLVLVVAWRVISKDSRSNTSNTTKMPKLMI